MKSMTLGICEVKPCMQLAENEFDLNGAKKYVCSKHSFLSFRSPESIIWKVFQDGPTIHFDDHRRIEQISVIFEARELTVNAISRDSFGAPI